MHRLFMILLAFALAGFAPTDALRTNGARIKWIQTFASPGDDWINDIAPIGRDRYLAVGFLNRVDGDTASDWRALAVDLNGGGRVLQRHEYGEGAGIDAFWAGAQARDRSRTYAGFTTRIGAGGIDAWIMRADARGRMLGETTIGDSAYDRVTGMAPADDGGWLLAGHSVAPGTDARRVLVAKVDAQGHEVWRRIYTEGATSGGLYIERSPDGCFILAGGADDDVLVMKLDGEGREIWRRRVGAPDHATVNHGLVVRSDGRIVVVGYTTSWGAHGENDMFAATLSPNGEVLSHSVIGGEGDDHVILARADANGRIWVVGHTKSAGAGDWDAIVAAVDDDGVFAPGVALIQGAGDDNGTAILPMANGDLLVGGYSASLGGGGEDAFVMRIAQPDLSHSDPRFTVRASD